MLKHKRFILVGGAVLALVTLTALTVAAFAQADVENTVVEPAPDLALELPGGHFAAPEALSADFQDQADRRPARQFIQEKLRENLAEALGVTPEQLDEARWTAYLATLEDAVEEGVLSQQAADRMVAQALIRRTAGREEIIAAGLGITVADLQAAQEEGKTVPQLVDELGLDATTIGQNLAAFLEELILAAADEGLISDAQAARILDDELLDRLARGLWRPWRQPQRPAGVRPQR